MDSSKLCSQNTFNSVSEHEINIEEGNCSPKIEWKTHKESICPDRSEFLQYNMDNNKVDNGVYHNEEKERNGCDGGDASVEINCHIPKPKEFGSAEFSFKNSRHLPNCNMQKKQNKRFYREYVERNWKEKTKNNFRNKDFNYQDHRNNPDKA